MTKTGWHWKTRMMCETWTINTHLFITGDATWLGWSEWTTMTFEAYQNSFIETSLLVALCTKVNRTRERQCNTSMRLGAGTSCAGKFIVSHKSRYNHFACIIQRVLYTAWVFSIYSKCTYGMKSAGLCRGPYTILQFIRAVPRIFSRMVEMA